MTSVWPYIAVTTPMSRTLAARSANRSDSSLGRPNSLTSMAPATLNRSVIIVPMAASSCIPSRVSRWSLRPTIRAGSRKSGMRTSAMRLTCQDR